MSDNKSQKEEYFEGRDCTCAAYSSAECACDADWTDPEIYKLRGRLLKLQSAAREVIIYQLTEARDRYGDATKAEQWACVITLRKALSAA